MKEADVINTDAQDRFACENVKIRMAVEDPEATWKKFLELVEAGAQPVVERAACE